MPQVQTLLIWFLFAIVIHRALQQDEDSTNDQLLEHCRYLNSVRANFTACCKYTALVAWDWTWDYCAEGDCKIVMDSGGDTMACCMLTCILVVSEIIEITSDPVGAKLLPTGLVLSFMMSVGNDSSWSPIVNQSISRCFSQFEGGGYSEDTPLDCPTVPSNFFPVIDCTYLQNYLKCPVWNPHGLEACQYSHQYVDQCFETKNDPQKGDSRVHERK